MDKNIYIFKTLDMLDFIAERFFLNFEKNNHYDSIICALKERIGEFDMHPQDFSLRPFMRTDIENYLYDLQIERYKNNIFSILNPGKNIEDADEDYVNNLSFANLNDYQLVRYLIVVFGTVNFNQKDNLLLLKYSKALFNVGWNNLSKMCRGKIIDLDTRKIVVYPFDKFFNLDETEETKQNVVSEMLFNADNISVTEKKDGSLIAVTNLGDRILVNTNGSFENEQIDYATEILKNKYSLFFNQYMPKGYTYIFELITPKDKHIVDYGNEEKLYLLGIRVLNEDLGYPMFWYDELKKVAGNYNLDCVESYPFTSLSDFIHIAEGDYQNKEGWVFRIRKEGSPDFMFKLKFREYFELHRMKCTISIEKVYKMLRSNTLDRFLTIASEQEKTDVFEFLEVINVLFNKAKEYVEETAKKYLEKYNISIDNLMENRNNFVALIQDVQKNELDFGGEILYYLKNKSTDRLFENCSRKKFFSVIMPKFM